MANTFRILPDSEPIIITPAAEIGGEVFYGLKFDNQASTQDNGIQAQVTNKFVGGQANA